MNTGNAIPSGDIHNERISSIIKIIFIIIITGFFLAMFVIRVPLYYLIAVIAMILLITMVVWKFEAAIFIYSLVAIISVGGTPDIATGGSSEGKGLFISQIMLGFLLAIWIIRYIAGTLPKNRIKSDIYLPLGLYLFYCVLSFVNGHLFWDPHVDKSHQYLAVNIIELGLRFLSAGALIIVATTITEKKWLNMIMFSLLFTPAWCMIGSLLNLNIPAITKWLPFMFYMPTALLLCVVLEKSFNIYLRVISAILICAIVFKIAYINVEWISGWLGLLIALFIVLYIKNRKLFFIIFMVACIVTIFFWSAINKNIIEHSKEEGDYDRFLLMMGSVKYASTFPLGVGLGNYRAYNTFYYGEKWGTTSYTSAHGTYSQHLAELGFPGFILLVIFLASAFIWFVKSYRKMPEGFPKLFIAAVIAQIGGLAVVSFIGDYIFPTYHNGGLINFSVTVYVWLTWGLAIAYIKIHGTESNGSDNINSELEYMRSD